MIVITIAHAGAGRRSGSAERRVCAVVIAHSPCLPRQVLSSKGPLLGHMSPKPEKGLDVAPPRPQSRSLDVAHTERLEDHFCVRRAHCHALVGSSSAKPTSHIKAEPAPSVHAAITLS